MGRTRGLSSHEAPKGAARRGWCLFLCRWGTRTPDPDEKETTQPPRNPTPSRGLLTHSATASSTTSHCVGRVARGSASKGGSPPDSPTAIRCPFAANPVVASAPTLRVANRVINTALSPALSGWGLRQRGVDNSIHNAPLSVWGLPNGNSGISFLRLRVPFATVANRYCQQRGGSGPLWVGPTPRPPLTNLIDNLRSARNGHPRTVQHLIGDPRLRLQGNSKPPTTHRVQAYREAETPLQGRTSIWAGHFPP